MDLTVSTGTPAEVLVFVIFRQLLKAADQEVRADDAVECVRSETVFPDKIRLHRPGPDASDQIHRLAIDDRRRAHFEIDGIIRRNRVQLLAIYDHAPTRRDDAVDVFAVRAESFTRQIERDPLAGFFLRNRVLNDLKSLFFNALPAVSRLGAHTSAHGGLLLRIESVIEQMRVGVNDAGYHRAAF